MFNAIEDWMSGTLTSSQENLRVVSLFR